MAIDQLWYCRWQIIFLVTFWMRCCCMTATSGSKCGQAPVRGRTEDHPPCQEAPGNTERGQSQVSPGKEYKRTNPGNTEPGQSQVSPCQGYGRTSLRGRVWGKRLQGIQDQRLFFLLKLSSEAVVSFRKMFILMSQTWIITRMYSVYHYTQSVPKKPNQFGSGRVQKICYSKRHFDGGLLMW